MTQRMRAARSDGLDWTRGHSRLLRARPAPAAATPCPTQETDARPPVVASVPIVAGTAVREQRAVARAHLTRPSPSAHRQQQLIEHVLNVLGIGPRRRLRRNRKWLKNSAGSSAAEWGSAAEAAQITGVPLRPSSAGQRRRPSGRVWVTSPWFASLMSELGTQCGPAPKTITVDNGTGFYSRRWLVGVYRGVQLQFIRPGKPVENAFHRKLQRKTEDELLNASSSFELADARRKLEAWRRDYNQNSLHSSIGDLTPVSCQPGQDGDSDSGEVSKSESRPVFWDRSVLTNVRPGLSTKVDQLQNRARSRCRYYQGGSGSRWPLCFILALKRRSLRELKSRAQSITNAFRQLFLQ